LAENWQKSQKIVILTSTPDHTASKRSNYVPQKLLGENFFPLYHSC
jgi:hypothetical protein